MTRVAELLYYFEIKEISSRKKRPNYFSLRTLIKASNSLLMFIKSCQMVVTYSVGLLITKDSGKASEIYRAKYGVALINLGLHLI